MAIFTPGLGYVQPTVLDGTMLSVGAQQQPVATLATNNRHRSRSRIYRGGTSTMPGFESMDSLILTLDAQYDTLPNQADWISYAAAINGEWQLCANCQPESTGKKLFRQYNFNRFLIGLPLVTVPVDATEFAAVTVFTMNWLPFAPGQPISLSADPATTQALYFVVPVNQQLANPAVPVPIPGATTIGAGDVGYAALLTIPPFTTVQVCVFTTNGAPGLQMGLNRAN